jgi:cytoskeleton protein RodZ
MKKKTSAQAESPESTDPVASQLGVARLRLGWTIEEASARTRLHLNVIRKLEAGDFDKFPSSAYARGFLKIYSRELGLDSKKILREFQPLHNLDDSILDIRPEMLEALPTRASEPVLTPRGLGLGVLGLVGIFVVSVLGIQIYRVWPMKSPKDPSTLAPIGAVEKTTPATTETSATATPAKPGEALSSLPMVQNSDSNAPKTWAQAAGFRHVLDNRPKSDKSITTSLSTGSAMLRVKHLAMMETFRGSSYLDGTVE